MADDHAEMYLGLRRTALDAVVSGLRAPGPEHPDVCGVVIDIPAGENDGQYATLVAMTDRTTSLYTSIGGGIIGSGEHEPVAAATEALLAAAQEHLTQFVDHPGIEHPADGYVRVFILTPAGRRVSDVPEAVFWGESAHGPMSLVAAAQDVVTALREAPQPSAT